jgi:hypothetical protein
MENVVVDSESYSAFDPSQAPQWSVQVKMAKDPACLLSKYFIKFIQLRNNNSSMYYLLGDLVDRGKAGKNAMFSKFLCFLLSLERFSVTEKLNVCMPFYPLKQFMIPLFGMNLFQGKKSHHTKIWHCHHLFTW